MKMINKNGKLVDQVYSMSIEEFEGCLTKVHTRRLVTMEAVDFCEQSPIYSYMLQNYLSDGVLDIVSKSLAICLEVFKEGMNDIFSKDIIPKDLYEKYNWYLRNLNKNFYTKLTPNIKWKNLEEENNILIEMVGFNDLGIDYNNNFYLHSMDELSDEDLENHPYQKYISGILEWELMDSNNFSLIYDAEFIDKDLEDVYLTLDFYKRGTTIIEDLEFNNMFNNFKLFIQELQSYSMGIKSLEEPKILTDTTNISGVTTKDGLTKVLLKRFKTSYSEDDSHDVKIYNKDALIAALNEFETKVSEGKVFGEDNSFYDRNFNDSMGKYNRYLTIDLTNIKFKIHELEIKDVDNFVEVYGLIHLIKESFIQEFLKQEPTFGLRAIQRAKSDSIDLAKVITFDLINYK